MVNICISENIKSLCPKLRLGCIEADVIVAESVDELTAEINFQITQIKQTLVIEDISKISVIDASRKAYRACGKDPARYRLSA
jgi:DNA/RNA-binding domain of Phe-tRNA-synthetase-like protein